MRTHDRTSCADTGRHTTPGWAAGVADASLEYSVFSALRTSTRRSSRAERSSATNPSSPGATGEPSPRTAGVERRAPRRVVGRAMSLIAEHGKPRHGLAVLSAAAQPLPQQVVRSQRAMSQARQQARRSAVRPAWSSWALEGALKGALEVGVEEAARTEGGPLVGSAGRWSALVRSSGTTTGTVSTPAASPSSRRTRFQPIPRLVTPGAIQRLIDRLVLAALTPDDLDRDI